MISHCSIEIPNKTEEFNLDEFRENRETLRFNEEISSMPVKCFQNGLNKQIERFETREESE